MYLPNKSVTETYFYLPSYTYITCFNGEVKANISSKIGIVTKMITPFHSPTMLQEFWYGFQSYKEGEPISQGVHVSFCFFLDILSDLCVQ